MGGHGETGDAGITTYNVTGAGAGAGAGRGTGTPGGRAGVVVTGSIAIDTLHHFPGRFADRLLPDQLASLSVSFNTLPALRRRGGTGGNIAYTAGLLGLAPRLVGVAGDDAAAYARVLADTGVDTSGLVLRADEPSAGAAILSDAEHNQITAFSMGAGATAGEIDLAALVGPGDLVIVAPNTADAMRRFPAACRAAGARCLFDPGQGLPLLSGTELLAALTGGEALLVNAYELGLLTAATGEGEAALADRVRLLVVTRGGAGATIWEDGRAIAVPPAPVARVVDPTGAGDAFRAGLLFGLAHGWSAETAGRCAAVAGAYAVEHAGAQDHRFAPADFAARYRAAFGEDLPAIADR